jgi:hypothetical protein
VASRNNEYKIKKQSNFKMLFTAPVTAGGQIKIYKNKYLKNT